MVSKYNLNISNVIKYIKKMQDTVKEYYGDVLKKIF